MFSEEKAAHLAAYLLLRHDRQMPYLKLIKLLYLSERQAMAKWGIPMSGDRFVSMNNGPVLSNTYDIIRSGGKHWKELIQKKGYNVSVDDVVSVDDLDELSRAEMKILDETFDEFGHLGKFDLVTYTHENCEEWEEPNGSSYPIRPESILKAMGVSDEKAAALIENAHEVHALDMMKVNLR